MWSAFGRSIFYFFKAWPIETSPMSNSPLFPLPPELVRVVLGSASFIDQQGLNLGSMEEAREFALGYGYDVGIPNERHHLVRVFEDALAFMEEVILDGTGLDVPSECAELQDPLQLLVWASERPMNERARWSCALLRIMHTLIHVDNDIYLRFLPEIQQQISERYEHFLVPTQGGGWALKGRYEVPVVAVRRKERKDRVSMLIKLLHKPENVAETIYDQIGIRFVAEDLLGVLLVLRFLLDHHVLMANHLKPSRTRNLMVDLSELEQWMASLPDSFSLDALSPQERQELSARLTHKRGNLDANPFSSTNYSAVQLTARTLIRIPNPSIASLNKVQERLLEAGHPDLGDMMHIPELIQKQDEFTFFFAHEVQVMERSGFENIVSGPASHSDYKDRQRDAVRKRVLQGIVPQEASC